MHYLRVIFCLAALVGMSGSAFALEEATTKSLDARGKPIDIGETYISPFLERDRINIVAIGDWVAHGVWWGMFDRFKKDKSVSYTRQTSYGSGFIRKERFDWNARITHYTSRKRIDVAIIAFGINDGRDIKLAKETYKFNSDKWRDIYTQRVDQFIVSLKQHGAAIYWVGLPIVRNADHSEKNKIINGIFKQLARKNDVKFIESWYAFTDKNGAFSFAGVDINDRPRILRSENGLHFTMPGYKKLGKLVDRILSADLSAMEAAAQSGLKGSTEREIAISTPDSGLKGSMTPEQNTLLQNRGQNSSFINRDSLVTGSVKRTSLIAGQGTAEFSQMKDELTPRAIKDIKTSLLRITKPEAEKADSSLASPEMSLLFDGGQLKAKPGRDDDYSWPR